MFRLGILSSIFVELVVDLCNLCQYIFSYVYSYVVSGCNIVHVGNIC